MAHQKDNKQISNFLVPERPRYLPEYTESEWQETKHKLDDLDKKASVFIKTDATSEVEDLRKLIERAMECRHIGRVIA